MAVYAVHAAIVTHKTDRHGVTWEGARQVPTFYLDSRVQGIVSRDHAARIAGAILNPLGLIPAADLRISAVPVDPARESRELDQCAAEREHAAAVSQDDGHGAWCAGPVAHTVPAGR